MPDRPRWPVVVAGVLLAAGLGLRVVGALRPGLWADEIFSLAMATGHSLEHPAAAADSAVGDFVQPANPQPASALQRYTHHDRPPAGAAGVIRAVRLSDTSPPLYYVVLNWWTRAFGTSDAALRLFSLWWAMLSVPLLWRLSRAVGRAGTGWTAGVLFSLSPVALYYSTEGRMYSLLWCLAAGFAGLTLELPRRRTPAWMPAVWTIVGIAGLLTHYFFLFVWLACVGWLLRRSFRRGGWTWMPWAAATVLAVLPWYSQVPASLRQWRVSAGWLDGELRWPGAATRPLALAAYLVSGRTPFGWGRGAGWLPAAVVLATAIWIVVHGRSRRLFSDRRLLLWAWLGGACLGPLGFDLILGTTTTSIPRYVLAGLPAALVLGAVVLGHLPPKPFVAAIVLVVASWLPGIPAFLSSARESWTPHVVAVVRGDSSPVLPTAGEAGNLGKLGRYLRSETRRGDLVLVQSIPSGVVGVARYLPPETPMASWVEPLKSLRVPADLERLIAGQQRVVLVKVHELDGNAPAEEWLLGHAELRHHARFPAFINVMFFTPVDGGRFTASAVGGRAVGQRTAQHPTGSLGGRCDEAGPPSAQLADEDDVESDQLRKRRPL